MNKKIKLVLLSIIVIVFAYLIFIKFINNKMVSLPCFNNSCPIGTSCVDMGKDSGGLLCVSEGECSLCSTGECEILEKYPPGIHCLEVSSDTETVKKEDSNDYKCKVDSDCALDACSGARTKEYWDSHPIRNACLMYPDHHAACVNDICVEVPN